MDGRLLLARLGPTTHRRPAQGIEPSELTEHEIASALAMIKDDFIRELLRYVWFPQLALSSVKNLERMVLHHLLLQCKVRAMKTLVTQLTYNIAELELTMTRRHSLASAEELSRYEREMNNAKERRWPAPSPVYQRMARSVLAELRGKDACSRCRGSGRIHVNGASESCPRCRGSGQLPQSDLARARALDMTWHAYTKSWREPYEWAISHCEKAITTASNALLRNLTYYD